MQYLKKFPNLTQLTLHGNKLKMLPLCNDLNQLTDLDLSYNQIKIDGYLLDSLFSIPKLKHLKIDGSENDMRRIMENLPNLHTLNDKKVVRKKIQTQQIQRKQKYLNILEKQKNQLKNLNQQMISQFQIKFIDNQELQFVYNESKKDLLDILTNVSHNETTQAVFYNCKKQILETVIQNIIDTMHQNGYSNCGNALSKIHMLYRQYFDSIYKVILQIGYAQNYLEHQFKQDHSDQKNFKLRKQRLYLKQILRLKRLVSDFRFQINKLEQQNQKYVNKLYKQYNGSDIQGLMIPSQPLTPLSQPEIFDNIKQQFKLTKNNQKTEKKKSLSPISKSMTPSKSQPIIRSKSNVSLQQKFNQQSKPLGPLKFEQTLSLVEQIVKQKQIYNKRCLGKKETFETAQQFLSLFFTRKYGLKSLAINSSLSLIKSLQSYSKNSTLLQVFIKILKNKLEQSFYEEHRQFIKKINKKLPMYFRKAIKNGQTLQVPSIFEHYFPNEDIDNYKITIKQQITTIEQVQILKTDLYQIHIQVHEKQLQQFLSLYQKYDRQQNGVISTEQAHSLVKKFFKNKIQEQKVDQTIIDKIEIKFANINKQKLVFSEIVQIVDKI